MVVVPNPFKQAVVLCAFEIAWPMLVANAFDNGAVVRKSEKESTMLNIIIIPVYLCAKISWYVVVDFYFSYKCRFTSVLFCWKELILNISLDITANGKAPSQCPIRVLVVHTALQSTPLLCPMPCDAPLYDNSHGEACVCVWVRENVCLWFMCVCEFGGKAELCT